MPLRDRLRGVQTLDWLVLLLFVVLVGYAWRFIRLYETIDDKRAAVSDRAEWLGELTALGRDVEEGEGSGAEGAFGEIAETIRSARGAAVEATVAADLERAAEDIRAGNRTEALRHLHAALIGLRAATGTLTAELGVLVDDTRTAVVGGLVFGIASVIALASTLRALAAMARWRRRWTLLTQATADGVFEWDIQTGRVEYSGAWRLMTGAGEGDTLQLWWDSVHPEDLGELRAAVDAHVAGSTRAFEAEYRLSDGRGGWRWVLGRGLAERDGRGAAQGMAFWQTDITDRRAQADAVERAALLSHVTDALGAGVIAIDEDERVSMTNAAIRDMAAPWGSLDAFWSLLNGTMDHPTLTGCPVCGQAQRIGGRVVDLREPGDKRRVLEVAWTGHGHRLVPGRVVTVVMVQDITRRALADEAAESAHADVVVSKAELGRLMDAIPEVLLVLAQDQILYANAAARTAFGPSAAEALSALRGVGGTGAAALLRRLDGTDATFEVSVPVAIRFNDANAELVVAHDVSQRVRMESQLRSAERMVALGGLAAGLAHEINNPLTYVIGNLELAQEGIGDVPGRIARALGGAVRVRQVVAQLRALANPGSSELVSVPVGPTFESALTLAAGVGLPPAQVTRDFSPGIEGLGNAVWLGQIALNLVSNALLSMSSLPPSARRLTLRSREEGEDAVVIEVIDSGTGIPEAMRDRIFEPFVSTRIKEEGSGLGLYICRELAGRMGAELSLETSGPQGTTFVLRLRRATSPASAQPASASPAPRPVASRGRVLIVDDEAVLGEVLQTYLGRHEVRWEGTAAGARVALSEGGWDVVILDIVLPGASGIDLWQELRQKNPALAERVVFVTGGSMTPDVARFMLESNNPSLVKPFDFRELVELVDARVSAAREEKRA
ncbi:hypothetical protein LBMAG42_09650 [Deltaproteobacteria bacterium]|nr:hypothetical protein LBMAG42_09650 [Deltaproteobacteria bacterium]